MTMLVLKKLSLFWKKLNFWYTLDSNNIGVRIKFHLKLEMFILLIVPSIIIYDEKVGAHLAS